MLLASFAVVMAFETALGTIFRDFRSYACILAGYTIAIVSISNINAPDQVFAASINRVAAIVVGIAAIGITNAFLATAESSRSLLSKLREATVDITALVAEGHRRAQGAGRLDLHRSRRETDAAALGDQLRHAGEAQRAKPCQRCAQRAPRTLRDDLRDPGGRRRARQPQAALDRSSTMPSR